MRRLFFDGDGQVRNGWKIAGCIFLTIAFAAALIILRRLLPREARLLMPEPLLAFFGGLIAAWLCLRLERAPLASIGLTLDRRFGREFGLGIAGGAILLGILALVVWLCGGFQLAPSPTDTVAFLSKGAVTFFAIAASEEIVFRGYPFQRAIRGMGPAGAQFLFAVLFAAAHLPNPGMSGVTLALAMLSIFLASLMLGYLYIRTRSLALPIGAHMGWNWAQATLGFAGSGNEQKGLWHPVYQGKPEWLTGGDFGLEASVLCIVLLGIVVLGLGRWRNAP